MPKKIMVVDDDPVVVKYLETLFQDNGYETCSAADGVEAADVFQKEKPDLITLDLEMEREWGTRFYRKLTRNDELKDIPVIVISGMPRPDLAIKKAVATIAKPFNPEQVLQVVKDAIG
jgi:CheY-like chemotaxis protein